MWPRGRGQTDVYVPSTVSRRFGAETKMWGDQFRMAFGQIGCLRSIIPKDVKVMALTATATYEKLQVVTGRLAMSNPALVALSPHRPNIYYKVQPAITLDDLSSAFVAELSEKRTAFPKTVLFCRQYRDCSNMYAVIRHKMGTSFAEPLGYPDLSQFRMVELYTRVGDKGLGGGRFLHQEME